MLIKLAFRNIGKSFRDYAVYFFTLAMGVCVFYMFNSIYAQQELMQITSGVEENLKSIQNILSVISVFVAIIMGFLIIYANQYFIRRRKKELGIYKTLGMTNLSISTILVLETSLLALIALAVGLIMGVFGSQFMSVFTAKVFEADMANFEFVFSLDAMLKSMMYFGLIFLVVIFFNVYAIRKYELIDLIYGSKKNETSIITSIKTKVILFILSIIILIIAYTLILLNGVINFNMWFALSIGLGIIGTLLFFFSVSGILVYLIQKNKRIYFRDLNMFVVRQITSKLNTNFITVSVVSLILLMVIGVFSTGYSVQGVLSENIKAEARFDFSLYELGRQDELKPIFENLPEDIRQYEGIKNWSESRTMDSGMIYKDFLSGTNNRKVEGFLKMPITLMSLNDFNNTMELIGEEALALKKGSYVISYNQNGYSDLVDKLVSEKPSLPLAGESLILEDGVRKVGLSNNPYNLVLVVEDSIAEQYPIIKRTLNIESRNSDSVDELEIKFDSLGREAPFVYYNSKAQIYASSITLKAVASFIAIYLGFIFMITCAAVLAIQQLSEAADNRDRYLLLAKLGVEENMIHRGLFTQILSYFLFPLFLAIIHSIVGLTAVNKDLSGLDLENMGGSIFVTATFVILIYGIYFIMTYMGSKKMIKN